jgi:hypothetical protein
MLHDNFLHETQIKIAKNFSVSRSTMNLSRKIIERKLKSEQNYDVVNTAKQLEFNGSPTNYR